MIRCAPCSSVITSKGDHCWLVLTDPKGACRWVMDEGPAVPRSSPAIALAPTRLLGSVTAPTCRNPNRSARCSTAGTFGPGSRLRRRAQKDLLIDRASWMRVCPGRHPARIARWNDRDKRDENRADCALETLGKPLAWAQRSNRGDTWTVTQSTVYCARRQVHWHHLRLFG